MEIYLVFNQEIMTPNERTKRLLSFYTIYTTIFSECAMSVNDFVSSQQTSYYLKDRH